MRYIFNFKTKKINLDIEASENYIEEIRINKSKQDERLNQKEKNAILLGADAYDYFKHLNSLLNLLDKYFSGKIVSFRDVPINFDDYSNFAKKIFGALRCINYGETASYKDLALKAGFSARYSRACAKALSINKTPIVVPCHRIIYSNNKLGGYSVANILFKSKLLSLERSAVSL